MVLHEAHSEITALRRQIKEAERSEEEVYQLHESSPQYIEMEQWKNKLQDLKLSLYRRGLTDEQIDAQVQRLVQSAGAHPPPWRV